MEHQECGRETVGEQLGGKGVGGIGRGVQRTSSMRQREQLTRARRRVTIGQTATQQTRAIRQRDEFTLNVDVYHLSRCLIKLNSSVRYQREE